MHASVHEWINEMYEKRISAMQKSSRGIYIGLEIRKGLSEETILTLILKDRSQQRAELSGV